MNTAELVYLDNGRSLAIDPAACTGCGVCLEVCPHNVIELLPRDKGRVAAIRRRELCMECGACQKNCPTKAITVESGVGCVAAIVNGMLRGTAPSCDCGGEMDGKSKGKGSCCC